MAREKYVDIKIRAQDQYSAVLNKGQAALAEFQKTASRKDVILASQAQKAAISDLKREIDQLQATYADYNRQVNSGAGTRQMGVDMVQVRAKIIQSKDALQQMQATLGTLRGSSRSTFAEFSRGADTAKAAYNSAEAQLARYKARLTEIRDAQNAAASSARRLFQNQAVADRVGPGFGAANRRLAEESAETIRKYKTEVADLESKMRRLQPTVKGSFLAFSQQAQRISASAAATRASTQAASENQAALSQLSRASGQLAAAQRNAGAAVRDTTSDLNAQQLAADQMGRNRVGSGNPNQQFGGATADVEMYGLRPYQMVNLGYQLNDVVSGLALGQEPLQILAQQVGQLIQIWPQAMVVLVRGLPILGALGVAFAPIIANIAALNREAQSVQFFTQQLALLADSGGYTAEGLAQSSEAIRELGLNTEDARKLVKAFVEDGIRPDRIEEFAGVAADLAEVIGVDVAEAARSLTDGFSGGFDELRELDKELNIFSAAQLEAIRAMYEAGDAAGAQELALDTLQSKLADSAQEAGPWGRAMSSLGGIWTSLMDLFEDSIALDLTIAALDGVAKAIETVGNITAGTIDVITSAASRIGRGTPIASEQEMFRTASDDDLRAALANQDRAIAEERSRLAQAEFKDNLLLNELLEERAILVAEIANTRRADGPIGPQLPDASENPGLTQPQLERLRKEYGDFAAAVAASNAARAEERVIVGQSSVDAAAEIALREQLAAATEAGITQLPEWAENWARLSEEIRASVQANYDAEKAQEALNEATESSAQLVEDMRSDYTKAKDVVADFEAGIDLLKAQYGELDPKVVAATSALARYKAQVSAAVGESYALAQAASELGRALASIGTFEADITRRLATAQSTIRRVEAGVSQARIEAENEYNRANAERNQTLIEEGRFTVDQIAALASKQIDALTAVKEAEAAAQEAMRLAFNPPKERQGGGGQSPADGAREAFEKALNDLLEKRAALLEQIEAYKNEGESELAGSLQPELDAVNAASLTAIGNLETFLGTLSGPDIDAAVIKLGLLRQEIQKVAQEGIVTGQEIDEMIAKFGSSALTGFAEDIANGENAIDSLGNAFRKFASDFLLQIGQMIVQQAILNALQATMGIGGGGIGGTIASGINAIVRHDGGLASARGATRVVPASIFAGAARYHGGGGPKLAPNEVPAILESDEEVLTREDPRHQLNGGGRSQPTQVKVVNMIEGAAMLEAALNSKVGEDVMLNWVRNNPEALQGAMS